MKQQASKSAHKPLGYWAVGPLAVGALCALSSASQAQTPIPPMPLPSPTPTTGPSPTPTTGPTPTPTTGPPTPAPSAPGNKLAGSDDTQGYWTVSSKWKSGSVSGTIGSFGTEAVTDDYAYDLSSGNFTNLPDFAGISYEFQSMRIDGQSIYAESGSLGTLAKTKASGTIEFTYKWVPTVAGGKPSKDLNVLISGNTSASASSPFLNPSHRPEGKASAWADGKPTSSNTKEQDEGIDPSAFTNGAKLFKISKNALSSTATFSLGAEASTPGIAPPPGQDGRSAHRAVTRVSVNASTRFDNRSVGISRVGAHDEWTDGDVTHGDTTYSYIYYFGTMERQGRVDRLNTQEFVANLGGDWIGHEVRYGVLPNQTYMVKGTDHQWSPTSDHSHSPDDWNKASFDVPYGNKNLSAYSAQPEWEGSSTNRSDKTITYTVKDNRNNEGEITAEAKYVLHIHDPIEVLRESTESASVNVMLYNSNGQAIATPNDPRGVKAGDVTVGTGTSSSTGWSVGGSFDLSFIKESLKILKLDFKYSVTNAETVSTTARLGFDLQPGEKAYAMVTHYYTRHHQYVYKYDQGGRNVRMGTFSGLTDPTELHEVPHEIFADEGPTEVSPPFWAGPIGATEVPPATPTTPPPFKSTYTS